MNTGEGGLLQVCLEGVGLLFSNSKFFVRLDHIRKCFTQKGGIFVLEEYNPKTRNLIQRKYQSSMSDQICYSVLCVFSYVAAGQDQKKNPVVITPQIQDIHAQQKQKHQQQQQHQQPQQQQQPHQTTTQQNQPTAVASAVPTTTAPAGQVNPNRMTAKSQAGSISIRHTVPMQKPTITMSTVQPQARMPAQVATASVPVTVPVPPTPAPPTSNPAKLPQLPPRVPSQPSTESLASISSPPPKLRTPMSAPPGPPPAIPPRTGAISRSGSVPAARSFVRQASANSTPPQYTPQPPPPFVIPKRHSGLARASTLSSSTSPSMSSSSASNHPGHSQSQRRASHGSVAAVLQSMPEAEPGYGSGSGSISGSGSGSGSASGSIASASPQAHRKH
nr:HL01222p [Drosophila melanogaster]